MHAEFSLILASRSPQRKQLLAESGYVFEILLPDEDAENARLLNELPEDYVRRLALQKAKNVAEKVLHGIILGCDTIVLCGETILEKPVDYDDARRMLHHLCGRVHHVLSGLCLIKKNGGQKTLFQETAKTELFMQPISEDDLEKYLETGMWRGKAGALGYQDGNDWIAILEGSESNVVGLPLELFRTMYGRLQD